MTEKRWEKIFYAVVRGILAFVTATFWRAKVEGAEKIPSSGAFVLAPVHRSNVDFALVSTLTRRKMRFMGKHTLWKVAPFGKFISALGAFPVVRGTADRDSLKACISIVRSGYPLVIFPEGTRQSGPEVQPLFEGAAYIASRTGVPVVPVGIGGSEQVMPKGSKMIRPARVSLVVGDPIYPEPVPEGGRAPRRSVHELTERLDKELQLLFDRATHLAHP
ncbi:MAG TPA: lysophospholipid acyltransferase family protein [Acidimicrobiales bacterium]|nr:lysophospholipid acyltransferase family protein [Acidimicrobiales bacterium]